MFILDSLFLSGFRWVLDTVRTAAEAEMDDDTALRDRLMAAELRRELGEISDAEFAAIESDLLARIREIKERREGGSGPIAFGGAAGDAGAQLAVEATVSGDFHEPAPPAKPGAARPARSSRAAPAKGRSRTGRNDRPAARRKIRKS